MSKRKRVCEWCGGNMDGMKRNARFCCSTCRCRVHRGIPKPRKGGPRKAETLWKKAKAGKHEQA